MRFSIVFLISIFILTGCVQNTGSRSASGTSSSYSSEISDISEGTQDDFIVNIGDRVFFELNKSDLDGSAKATLRQQAEWLNQFPSTIILIEGHCDERGTREYNLALGSRRANAVRTFLLAEGIAPDRIDTISFGKERPAALGSTEEAWAQNRRSVITLQ